MSQNSDATSQLAALPAAARMMIPGPEYDLIRRMVGQWQVNMRIWPADGAEPMVAPPMVATRELVRDTYGWGQELTGQLVKQRRLLTVQDDDTTLCRQYWTLPAATPYLSVEYVYKRV